MKKSFITNLGILIFVNLLIKPGWLAIDWLVQRNSGAIDSGEGYGLYFALFNLAMMFNIILDLGINNYNNRKVAAINSRFKSYFSSVFSLRIVLAFVYSVFLILLGFVLGYSVNEIRFLALLSLNNVLLGFVLYLRSNLTALGYFKWDSFVSILDRVLMIGAVLILFIIPNKSIAIIDFVYVQTFGYSAAFIITLLILFREKGFIKPTWNGKFNKSFLAKSFPYAIIVVLMSIYSLTDSVMVERLLTNGKQESGIYAQSYRIMQAFNNYGYLVSVILLPTLAGMLQRKEKVMPIIKLSGSMLIYTFSVIAIIVFCNSEELMAMLYGEFNGEIDFLSRFSKTNFIALENPKEVSYSAKIFVVLLIALVPMSFNFIYGALLTAGGRMAILNTIAVIGVVMNVTLNLILIPKYHAYGAAMASLVTQVFTAVGQWFAASKEFKFSLDWFHLFKFILAVIIVLSITYYFIVPNFDSFNRILITGIVSLVPSVLLFKLSEIKELKSKLQLNRS